MDQLDASGHLPLPDLDAMLDGPPKRGRGRPRGSTTKPSKPQDTFFTSGFSSPVSTGTGKWGADAQIREGLTRYYSLSGLLLSRLDPTGYDSTVVLVMAEKCADGWIEVGHEYPEVYRALKLITAQNALVDLGFAHLAIGIGVAANHGLVPVSWVAPFSLPIPQPQAAQAASVPMGIDQRVPYQPTPFQPASPLEVPVMPVNPPRVDASATGEGLGQVPGMQPVQFSSDMIELIKKQALEAELAQRAQAQAQAQMAVTGMPGYNPADTAPRQNQNPSVVGRLIQRRG